jgi:hypothetical protein
MNKVRLWETPDEMMTLSLCPEGCVHLRVGRAIIKMNQEEFFSLAKLTDKAARELRYPDPAPARPSETGH